MWVTWIVEICPDFPGTYIDIDIMSLEADELIIDLEAGVVQSIPELNTKI